MLQAHRIIITGASGFVGAWLQREFESRRGRQGLDITVLAAGRGNSSGWSADITDQAQVTEMISNFRPTAVIHLAALAAPGDARKMPHRAWDINFHGTMNMAYATMEFAPDARFIFSGSSEAYGASFIASNGSSISESAALNPMNVYGATKAAADILIGQLACDGLRAIRFRPFNHTGPGQSDDYVAGAFAMQLAQIYHGLREPSIKVGNLSALRDFLDVRDVVRAYADSALQVLDPNVFGKAYNLATGKPTKIHNLLEMLIELSALKVEIAIDKERMRPSEIEVASGDSTAAFEAFGWQPEIPLRETLIDVFAYWKRKVLTP